MSPEVVTAMIQQDQRIRTASLAGATVTSPNTPAPSVWAANQPAAPANAWQQDANEPAPAAQPSTATTVPPPPAAEAPAPETVNYFYDSLAPYGTWVDVEGYGRCWRPTAVVTTPGWRPYSNSGRWEWTDSGWYWYSDYSWGWAPFHYGRWYSHPRWGWCWMPGSTWGPSWVSWRYSDSYCGWAPLPPAAYYAPSVGFTYFGSSCGSSFSFGLTWDCFTFVSYHNFHSRRYDRDCVPHHQAGQVYNNTTVVNNIIRGNNNTIINQGIAPTQITAASGVSIRQVNINNGRDPRNNHTTRHEELAHDGHTLNVIRTTVPTGHGHATVGVTGPTRGGAQNLTTGNAVAAPAAPQTSLVPPPRQGGPGRVAPIRIESPAPTIRAAQPSTPAAPTASTSTASPTPPAVGSTTSTVRGHAPTTANGSIRGQGTPGALIIRAPQNSQAQHNLSGPTVSLSAQPAATPVPSPASPVTASTPVPPRNVQSQSTPWLNQAPAPAQSQPVVEQSGNTRNFPTRHDPRNGNNNPRSITPNYAASAAPPSAQSAPSYQTPTPPRAYSAPAQSQPAPSYTPPTRSPEPHYTPAPSAPPSQPTYSAPPRQSEPSHSSSPSRSEPRSESHSSSSRGSDSSKSSDNRSPRGR